MLPDCLQVSKDGHEFVNRKDTPPFYSIEGMMLHAAKNGGGAGMIFVQTCYCSVTNVSWPYLSKEKLLKKVDNNLHDTNYHQQRSVKRFAQEKLQNVSPSMETSNP